MKKEKKERKGDILTFKYRIYPNKTQIKKLYQLFDRSRDYYNGCLEYIENEYKTNGNKISDYDAKKIIVPIVNKDNLLHDGIISMLTLRVRTAYKLMWTNFKKTKKIQKPKPKRRFFSIPFLFRYNNKTGKILKYAVNLHDNHQNNKRWYNLYVRNVTEFYTKKDKKLNPNLKDTYIKVRKSRDIPPNSKFLTGVIKKDNLNKWYLYLTMEVDKSYNANRYETENIGNNIGMDIGLKTNYCISDGTFVNIPDSIKKNNKKLRRLNRKMARRKPLPFQKSSNGYKRAKFSRRRLEYKLAAQRKEFNNCFTKELLKKYDKIAIEDFNSSIIAKLPKPSRKKYYNIGLSDCIHMLEYKGGDRIVKVNPKNTTQRCSKCGKLPSVKKGLKDRVYICEHCGNEMDRDLNAAVNIKDSAKI